MIKYEKVLLHYNEDNYDALDAVLKHILEKNPKFKIRSKQSSTFMKVLGKLMFWSKGFMRMTTTIGDTVYLPQSLLDLLVRSDRLRNKPFILGLFLHEYTHTSDRQRMGNFKYRLKYLSPQIYALGALLALLAPVHSAFLYCLGFLACLAPWPSKGRTEIEANGYEMSTAVEYWLTGKVSDHQHTKVREAFTSFKYYRMCPMYFERVSYRMKFGGDSRSRNFFLGDPRLLNAYKVLLTAGRVHESVTTEHEQEAWRYFFNKER